MVSFYQHHSDLNGYEVIIEIIHGNRETPLIIVWQYEMDVTPNMALENVKICTKLFSNLLRDQWDEFEFQVSKLDWKHEKLKVDPISV